MNEPVLFIYRKEGGRQSEPVSYTHLVTIMNKVILMGRLTKNPEIKYAGKDNDMAVARYTPVSYTHLDVYKRQV